MIDKSITNAGFHKQFHLSTFSEQERNILKNLSKNWYMTNSGEEIYIAQSRYRYFLMKPTVQFSEMFNIEREIICIFSDYQNFEPRAIDFFDKVTNKLAKKRTESVCGIIISGAVDVEKKIEALLKSDPEHSIIVPFTYHELSSGDINFMVQNKFRKHFYTRDLFSFLSPLKKDTYFFGRGQIVSEICNRYLSGEHTSLFGLRKSGKTSIVYAIERRLSSSGNATLSIDCESPSVHLRRWYHLLFKIATLYKSSKNSKINIEADFENRYSEMNAAESFEEDILKIYASKKRQPTLFIFDEIERITPHTASSSHWRNESDFIYFWQTMRGFYQKHPQVFNYMLVGTNPSCIESSNLLGHENPIFSSIHSQYVPNFTLEQVKVMVTTLGNYTGLKFDDMICAKLAEDFGGHPFLIRQICSIINSKAGSIRPIIIDKHLYNLCKEEFFDSHAEYLNMMIDVLREWYQDEYDMLNFLAEGDYNSFLEFAKNNPNYTRHLTGYGLIQKGQSDGYSFNLEVISEHLSKTRKYKRLNLTEEEKVNEISERRNRIEKKLRVIIRNTLKSKFGKTKSFESVLAAIPSNRRDSLSNNTTNTILDKDSSPLFFLDLKSIINKHWELFENIFTCEKSKFILMLDELNNIARPDAHAKNISNDDFQQSRLYLSKIETMLEEWD
ncbi:ATP-binding protein [Serratia marcescens]